MKLLFVSNLFPPLSEGGYEQWCREVALRLRSRGHDVRVLTSNHRAADGLASDPIWVDRSLHLEMALRSRANASRFFFGRITRSNQNVATLRRHLRHFAPDAILFWGLWNVDKRLAQSAETSHANRVAYYLGDYWPTLPPQDVRYWQVNAQSSLRSVPKKLLGALAHLLDARQETPTLRYPHALFCSDALRSALLPTMQPQRSTVVPGGVAVAPYLKLKRTPSDRLRLLYVGRFLAEKGISTIIEALRLLELNEPKLALELQIVGGGNRFEEATLRKQLALLRTPLIWHGRCDAAAMPERYANADALLFPSTWAEPFGRVLVEAMAAGLPIIGTRQGGAADLLTHAHNGLAFGPSDAALLAQHIRTLADDTAFGRKLGAAGRQRATQFDLAHMVSGIETYLQTHVIDAAPVVNRILTPVQQPAV